MSKTLQDIQCSRLYRSSATPDQQRAAFQSGDVPVAVYGLGRLGLSLSMVYASTTGRVVGVGSDKERVTRIDEGECPIDDEPRLPSLVRTATTAGAFSVTTRTGAVAKEASVHVIAAETGIRSDNAPDFSELRTLLRDIAPALDSGDLVLVESIVPPGTCRDIVQPILLAGSDLDADEFGVAACPSRATPGRSLREMRGSYPKIVGGVDAESTLAAALVYDELRVSEVVTVNTSTVAECARVVESVYRDVTIGLANELAGLADELDTDIPRAIEAANTHPRCDVPDPRPGTGGYDLPDTPYYLINECASSTPLIESARGVNESMPEQLANTLVRELAATETHIEDAVVLLLGLAHHPNVGETRAAPAIELSDTLARFGATVVGVDPLVEDTSAFENIYFAGVDHVREMDLDAVVVVTDHDVFDEFDWSAFDPPLVVLDGRGCLDGSTDASLGAHHVTRFGVSSSN
ncbi:nucleotide sugar dehydrogenase [Natranaeroarchaeum aerophilus]|uniref:UDP-N-acetyl-D-mannosamine dehydrogenase n=1 Tax=Natranaeroarchaeum aerophilus TaxID=2917711 RepID=A0AAE3K5G1_9EURY|nr:nucleotide sugar dehydrogenase [Natranaeroarchaeum aerophilus]MCL9814033.1 nucleotide sugar dehydrogenase [Natranaeroarchaeum aerophilus]